MNLFKSIDYRPNAHTNRGHFVLYILLILFYIGHNKTEAQTPIRPYTALLFAGDAAFVYYGPSLMIGADFLVHEKYDISVHAQFFSNRNSDGKFSTESFAVLYQRYFFGDARRFYIGIGLSLQHTELIYFRDEFSYDRVIITGAYRLGYTFYTRKLAICPEIDATGPYSYSTTGYGETRDLFTLPSIGFRIYRRDRDASGRRSSGF